MIMNHPPVETRFNTAVSDAVAPSEKGLFASSDTILYGKVEGFKWVVLSKEKDAFFRYRTILTVRVSNVYRGDLKSAKTVDILLPFSISGTGSGVWVEDNENACKLKKGSEAFFFANKFGDSDLIGDSSWNLHAKDISAYGTGWGDQYILPAQSGGFSYLFEPNKTLTFQDVEAVIKAG